MTIALSGAPLFYLAAPEPTPTPTPTPLSPNAVTPPWHFVVLDSEGAPIGSLTAATSKKAIWYLDDAATFGFNLPGSHPQAQLVEETTTDLLVYDGQGTKRFRGRFGSSEDDFGPDSGDAAQFTAVDYRGFLARRFVWPGATVNFENEDQIDIAWQLIADTQATTGGDLGIVRAAAPRSGVLRSEIYTYGTEILQLLTQIGELFEGFDWEIDPNLNFNTYFPNRGRDTGMVLAYGAQIVSGKRVTDTSVFANAIWYAGDSTLLPVTEVGAIGAAGRWEASFGDSTILDFPTLEARATWQLDEGEVLSPSYQVVLSPGWWSPDLLWLGDTATLVIKTGRLNVNAPYRATQIEVDFGDDGGQVVAVTFGPTVTTQQLTIYQALQRISTLERR